MASISTLAITSLTCNPNPAQDSLTEQILTVYNANKRIEEKQQIYFFNVGGGHRFKDPIACAKFLLKREYLDTYIFDKTIKKPVFIPESFISNCYREERSTLSDENTYEVIVRTLNNLEPTSWITQEINTFITGRNEVTKKDFELFLLNVDMVYLVKKSVPSWPHSPICNLDLSDCIDECNNILQAANKTSPVSLEFSQLCTMKAVNKISKFMKNILVKFPLKKHWVIERFDTIKTDLVEISAERAEKFVYEQLKEVIKIPDIVIIQGCHIYCDIANNRMREIDFLLLSAERKILISIECKRSYTDTAIDQVTKFKGTIEMCVGDILDSSWSYIPMVYFDILDYTVPKQPLEQVLCRKTDWKAWYNALLAKFPTIHNSSTTAETQLHEVIQLLVFCIHVHRPIVRTHMFDEVKKNIEKVTTPENIIFYSTNQLQMMSTDAEYNHVMFIAQYGSGMFNYPF